MRALAERLSYFDDFTDEEREQVRERMVRNGQTWDEIINRYGHPKTWEAEQIRMF